MNITFKECVEFLFSIGLIFNAVIFVPQIINLLKTKNSKNISLITFLGFNFVQLLTIFHAYYNNDKILMYGFILTMLISINVPILIVFYKIQEKKNAKIKIEEQEKKSYQSKIEEQDQRNDQSDTNSIDIKDENDKNIKQ